MSDDIKRAAVLRPGQFRHALRVAAVTGRMPERDVMLLWLTHTTGMRVSELAQLLIDDVMLPSGALRPEIYLRAAITKGCKPRSVYLTHAKAIAAVEAWLAVRLARGWGVSGSADYRGFRPGSKLVLTHKGQAFELAFKHRQLSTGPETYRACDALQKAISRLYRQAGVKSGSSHSGRSTLAFRVLASTGDVEVVQHLLAHADLDQTKAYLDVSPDEIRRAFEVAI